MNLFSWLILFAIAHTFLFLILNFALFKKNYIFNIVLFGALATLLTEVVFFGSIIEKLLTGSVKAYLSPLSKVYSCIGECGDATLFFLALSGGIAALFNFYLYLETFKIK